MLLPPFLIERMFAEHEFTCAFNLASSDVEGLALSELWPFVPSETREWYEALTLGYTEGAGHPTLRDEVAGWTGIGSAGAVQVFAGATEAAFVLLNALLSAGDHVVAVTPLYQLLLDVPRAVGADVTEVRLSREEGWELDIDAVRRSMRPTTRMVIVNFPHNPTGSLPSRGTFEELVDLVDGSGAYLLSDEIYRGAEIDPADLLPSAATLSASAISLAGMSKIFGMAGVRVGWVACEDPDVVRRLLDFRYWTTLATSAPSEVLALAGLQAAPVLTDRARTLVGGNLRSLSGFVADHDGWHLVPPRGGTCAYPWFEGGDASAWTDRLAREEGVLLAPGSVFGDDDRHVRFGLGRKDFGSGIEHLRRTTARRSRVSED